MHSRTSRHALRLLAVEHGRSQGRVLPQAPTKPARPPHRSKGNKKLPPLPPSEKKDPVKGKNPAKVRAHRFHLPAARAPAIPSVAGSIDRASHTHPHRAPPSQAGAATGPKQVWRHDKDYQSTPADPEMIEQLLAEIAKLEARAKLAELLDEHAWDSTMPSAEDLQRLIADTFGLEWVFDIEEWVDKHSKQRIVVMIKCPLGEVNVTQELRRPASPSDCATTKVGELARPREVRRA